MQFAVAARAGGAAVLAAALLAGCTRLSTQSGAPLGGGNPWTYHGVLRWAGVSNPDNLNPVVGNQQIEVDLSMFWAGYLFNWSDRNKFEPELATEEPTLKNGGISPDGLSITYHLRRGVKWQDGAPFTADDVIFTWHAVLNPKNNVSSHVGYELVTRIDKKDDHTIVVHLKKRFAPFVASFFTMSGTPYPILPKHILGGLPDINQALYNNKPIGTGPFKVVEYQPGSLLRMVANPDYWRGAPKLKEVDYHIVPDENTILTQLKTHEIDFEYNAPSSQTPSLRDIPGTHIFLTPFTQYRQLGFNTSNPILADVRVRRALAYATDTQQLIDDVSHGVDIKGDSDQPPFSWAHGSHNVQYQHDVVKANRLLDEAGWTGRTPDGVRVKNGKKLALELVGATGAAETRNLETLLQAQWKTVGVEGDIKNYNSGLLFASYGAGGVLQRDKFDVAFYSWINGVDPDDSTLFDCDQFPAAGGQNIYLYCNKELDAQEQVALTEYDMDKRKAAYDKIQQILTSDEPLIVVWYVRRQDVANTDLKNYKPAHAVTTFWNTWEWEI